MPRSESPLTPDLQDELARLDAALARDGSPDPTGASGSPGHIADGGGAIPADDLDRELDLLVAAVRTTRPVLDAGARMRLEERAEAFKAAPAARTGLRLPADRRWRLGLALGAVVAVAVPVGGGVSQMTRDSTMALSGELGGPPSDQAATDPTVTAASGGAATEEGPASSAGSTATGSEKTTDGSVAQDSSPSSSSADRSATGTAESSGGLRALRREVAPSAATKTAPLSATRRVIRDVEQTVRVAPRDVARAADRVTTIVQDAGGYLDSSQVREQGSRAGGRFQVVVPTGRLDATVAALSRIGRPVRLERSGRDVTDQATSLADRLADLRAARAAARLALARTVDPDRQAARRRELRLLSSRVAALQGQVDDLRRQTATSRIDLRLTTTSASEDAVVPAPDDGSWGIGDAWHDAGRVAEVAGGVVLIGGVVVLPLLLVGGLGLAARRRGNARRREATIDAA